MERIEQDSDHWFTPVEAGAYGLIDAVITVAAEARVLARAPAIGRTIGA